MSVGQITWNSRANLNQNEFVNEALIGAEMWYEQRHRGAFGSIAKVIKGRMTANSGKTRDDGLESHGIIKSQTLTDKVQARFTLTRNLDGTLTYGDAPVADGDYLAFMHASLELNSFHSPAYKMTPEMAKKRAQGLLGNGKEESEVKTQANIFLSEEYNDEVYTTLFTGQSVGLKLPTIDGGLAQDIGRGVNATTGRGKNITMTNVIVAGVGEVSNPSTSATAQLDTYETALATAITSQVALGASAGGPSIGLLQEIRRWVTEKKIRGFDVGGVEKWYCPVDPGIMAVLQKFDPTVGTSLSAELKSLWQGSKDVAGNPNLNPGFLEIDGFIFYPDFTLERYRPSISAGNPATISGDGAVRWGCAEQRNRRNYVRSANDVIAPMLILGPDTVLEANAGSITQTVDQGRHGQGASIAFHGFQSFQRTRWIPKDGTTLPELNNQCAMVLFKVPNRSFL